jgi:membrane associated rhomboid family serine protease
MLALILEYALATWLFASAFVLPHSTTTAVASIVVAFLMAAVALFAYKDPKRDGARYLLWILAVWLLVGGLVMPHESLGTILSDAAVGVLLGFVSIWAPRKARGADPAPSTN